MTGRSGAVVADLLGDSEVTKGHEGLNSVLGKCFAMLELFSSSPTGELRLSEIARESGIPKATAHRLAASLLEHGALQKHGEHYSLGVRIFEMACAVPDLRRLREMAMPYLSDLHGSTREVVHFAVLADTDVLYVDKLVGRRSASVPSTIGGRRPAHSTGLGKAMLAFSDVKTVKRIISQPMLRSTRYTVVAPQLLTRQLLAIRKVGVALEQDESVEGLSCVASPVLVGDRAVGAISVTTPSTPSRFRAEALQQAVREAAEHMSRVPELASCARSS